MLRLVGSHPQPDGSYLVGNGGPCVVPSYPIDELIDPTGAGDSYAGAFMGYLSRAGGVNVDSLRGALAAASAVASFACESIGPDRLLEVSKEDVAARMKALGELVRFPTN